MSIEYGRVRSSRLLRVRLGTRTRVRMGMRADGRIAPDVGEGRFSRHWRRHRRTARGDFPHLAPAGWSCCRRRAAPRATPGTRRAASRPPSVLTTRRHSTSPTPSKPAPGCRIRPPRNCSWSKAPVTCASCWTGGRDSNAPRTARSALRPRGRPQRQARAPRAATPPDARSRERCGRVCTGPRIS